MSEPEKKESPSVVSEVDRLRWVLVQEQIARCGEQQARLDREMRDHIANRVMLRAQMRDVYCLGPMDSFDPVTGTIQRVRTIDGPPEK